MHVRPALRAVALLTVLAALVLAACAAPSPSKAPPPPRPEVDVTTAAELRDAGAFVLDVREPDEWVAGHIPGAVHIPLGELGGRVAEIPADRTVVVVCRSGNRSAQGREILRAAGLPRVTSMAGGMLDWAAAGLPVVAGP
jgi:rhodanese-related sulfurtransferase